MTHGAAVALLTAVAQGQPITQELIDGLINAVLGHELVTLALASREPGPSQLMHALRLAAAVCQSFAAGDTLKHGTGA